MTEPSSSSDAPPAQADPGIVLRNVSPYGDLDVPLLDAVVAGGAQVDADERQARILLAQRTNFEPASPAAQAIADDLDAEAAAAAKAAEYVAEGREPGRNESAAVWHAYARLVSPHGADLDAIAAMTRTQLQDNFGAKAADS